MTVKYVDGTIARNANIVAPRRIAVVDDGGIGAGVVPAAVAATVVATEAGNGVIRRTTLTCTAVPIAVTDDAGVAQYGGVKLYTFPEGVVCVLGAMLNGSLTMGATGTYIDAYTGVCALGSITATTGATLVSTEATWLQETAMATAAAKVAVTKAFPIATQLTEAGSRWYNGSSTAAPLFFNVAIADDSTHTSGTGTWTGVVTITWSMLGDC